MGGMVGGYYAWELLRPHVKGVVHRVPRGEDTLPDVLGVSPTLLAGAVVLLGGAAVTWLYWRGRAQAHSSPAG